MRLLRDDFLVVENQFGTLNTQSQIVGYLNDPEHTPLGPMHPTNMMMCMMPVLFLPLFGILSKLIAESGE